MSDLTPRQRAQIESLKNLPDDQIDTSDIPEIAHFTNPRRGLFSGSPNRKAVPNKASGVSTTTDTTERGLETLICDALTGADRAHAPDDHARERPPSYGVGWILGDARDYDREHCVDLAQLSAFLRDTQPGVAESLDLGQSSPTRRKFLARLQGEIDKRGTIEYRRKVVAVLCRRAGANARDRALAA